MKKLNLCIGALLFLIPFSNSLLTKKSVFLSTTGLMLFATEKVNASSVEYYFNSALEKDEIR